MGLILIPIYAVAAVLGFAVYACIKVMGIGRFLVTTAIKPIASSVRRDWNALMQSNGQAGPGAQQSPMARINTVADRDVEIGRDIASYHIAVVFSDDFSANISVFKRTGQVRRKVRAVSGASSVLMRQLYARDSFELPDLTLSDSLTVEKVLLDTEAIGIQFIEDLLAKKDPQYFALQGKVLEPNTGTPSTVKADSGAVVLKLQPDETQEEQVARSAALLRGSMASADKPLTIAPVDVKTSVSVTKREAKGIVTGTIQTMGLRDIPPTSGKKGYATFEATLLQGDGLHVSFRGVRLNELFVENGVKVGDLVEIQSLGRTKVAAAEEDGRPTYRNEYLVKVLESA